ncbi:MAG: hypothetical protein JW940_08415 [Polyangiaceae bacterium]|nr:hypothetical protein [Polyangiaceae bacterium]
MSTKLLAFCVALVMLTVGLAPSVSADGGTVGKLAIVVGKDFPLDNLSFGDLKRLYLGYPLDAHGKRLIPLALQNRSPERVQFDRTVLGMNPDAVARYWVDRRIRGESGPPKAIDSPQILLRVVDKLDGAVGYVRADSVSGAVKVLRVDGKAPSDPGYRLHSMMGLD